MFSTQDGAHRIPVHNRQREDAPCSRREPRFGSLHQAPSLLHGPGAYFRPHQGDLLFLFFAEKAV